MLKKILTVFILLISCSAHAYDIKTYCKNVSDTVGGSYVIEQECRAQETQAKNEIASMTVPAHIRSYCNQVSDAVGGSYQIALECINQEVEAKNNLDRASN